MKVVSTNEARKELLSLINETVKSNIPIQIQDQIHSAVLISEEDWRAIQETLYLVSIPGMRESIIEGMKTPIEGCDKEIDW